MTKNEARIEVAYDIVSKIHTDICSTGTRPETDKVTEMTMDILRKLILLLREIKREGK